MLIVAAAIIENRSKKLLIAKRKQGKSQAGLWEFPGGKIEAGETAEDCLKRELLEEMNIVIEPGVYFGTSDYVYGETAVRLLAYKAVYVSGSIELADHDEYRWVSPGELAGFEFAPADVPFVDRLIEAGKQL